MVSALFRAASPIGKSGVTSPREDKHRRLNLEGDNDILSGQRPEGILKRMSSCLCEALFVFLLKSPIWCKISWVDWTECPSLLCFAFHILSDAAEISAVTHWWWYSKKYKTHIFLETTHLWLKSKVKKMKTTYYPLSRLFFLGSCLNHKSRWSAAIQLPPSLPPHPWFFATVVVCVRVITPADGLQNWQS